jgi:hypothetical protein
MATTSDDDSVVGFLRMGTISREDLIEFITNVDPIDPWHMVGPKNFHRFMEPYNPIYGYGFVTIYEF